MIELRPYQQRDIERIREAMDSGHRRILYQLPVGGGKTVVMADVMRRARERGNHILFVAHRRELIWQTQDKLRRFNIEPGIIMGREYVPFADPRIHVATIQSLLSPARAKSLPRVDLIVYDEAHRSVAPSYRKLLSQHPEATLIGITATPLRADGLGLGHIYETLIQGPTIPELIRDNYLVQPQYYAPTIPDLEKVRVRAGDYVDEDLEEVMLPIVGDAVEWWQRLAKGRKTIVFTPTVKHSMETMKVFRMAGIDALHVDGKTPTHERDKIFARFREPDGPPVLVNCEVAVEGVDVPETSCIVVMRPTKSLVRWIQMIGRGLRVAPHVQKEDCIVIDHSGTVYELGFAEDWNEWQLTTLRRNKDDDDAVEAEVQKEKPVECRGCKAVFKPSEIVIIGGAACCPFCLAELRRWQPKARLLHMVDGELQLVSRKPNPNTKKGEFVDYPIDKERFYRELLYIAQLRGYRIGWAAHTYRAKYKEWPPYRWQYLGPLKATQLTYYLMKQVLMRRKQEESHGEQPSLF